MMYAACYKMATFPIPPLPSRNILCEILISNFFAFHYLLLHLMLFILKSSNPQKITIPHCGGVEKRSEVVHS